MKKTLKLRVLSIAVVLFMLLAALPIGIFIRNAPYDPCIETFLQVQYSSFTLPQQTNHLAI